MNESVRLGECATFINGYAFKPTNWSKNGIPIIRIQNLTGSMNQLNYYNGKLDSKYIINNGDILMSWSASLGVFEWKNGKAYLNQHIFKVEFNKKDINKKYFVYLIKSKINEMKKNTHGSTMKHITKSDFDKIEIFLPNIQKQQEISNKLDKVQEIIDLRKKQIKELNELIKSMFVNMFENEKYPKKTLSELTDKITDGSHNPPTGIVENEGYMMLSSQNIINNSINYDNVRYLKKEDFEKENRRTDLQKGDVLLTIVGTVGRTAIITEESNLVLQRSVAVIKPNKEINSVYLVGALNSESVINQLNKGAKGVAQKGIYLNDLKKIIIKVPPIELQNQFADMVKQINKQKFFIEKSLKETEDLQESLMNKYFN